MAQEKNEEKPFLDHRFTSTFREPDDILSPTDTPLPPRVSKTVEGGYAERTAQRDKPREVPPESSKVLWLMLCAVALVVVGVLSWFVWPRLSSWITEKRVEDATDVRNPSIISPVERPLTPEPDTGPRSVDTDRDGLDNVREQGLGLNPENPDSDGDNLSDRDEVDIYNSDPRNPDTDGDAFSDGAEVKGGFDPNGPGKLTDIFRVITAP